MASLVKYREVDRKGGEMEKYVSSIVTNENQFERQPLITTEYPFALFSCKMQDFLNRTVIWHWHEEVELNYVRKGTMKVFTEDEMYEIHEGEVYFTNSNVMVMKVSEDNAWEDVIMFHPGILAGHFHSVFETKYMNRVLKNPGIKVLVMSRDSEAGVRIAGLMTKLRNIQEDEYAEFISRNLLSEIWLEILSDIKKRMPQISMRSTIGHGRFQSMIAFIHSHYAERISLQDIADSACISTREATRCFKKIQGKSPVDYLIEYRLGKARDMISQNDESITSIAMQCGFSDSAHFGKMFKRYYGIKPSECR